MDYKGEWGGGGPGHSWALKWHERMAQYKLSWSLFRYRVPAYDSGDPGSIPGRGKLNAWDPMPFWPLNPGSGIGFFRIPDLGSWIPTPNYFSPLSFVAVLDPGSGMAKNLDPGSGINIFTVFEILAALLYWFKVKNPLIRKSLWTL